MNVALPADLAPSLREAVERLIAECGLARYTAPGRGERVMHRCHGCKVRGGKMGGHHMPDGSVVWVHPRCHRRLHRAGRG